MKERQLNVEDAILCYEPKEVRERKEVREFAQAMEKKLASRDHLHPIGWRGCGPRNLLERLEEELRELHEALDRFDISGAMGECVDVANFAMMIRDVIKHNIEESMK